MSRVPGLEIAAMADSDLRAAARIDAERPNWGVQLFAGELAQPCGHQLVARLPGVEDLVGFLCLRLVAGEAEIVKFTVDAPLRRRGVGSALLAAALDLIRRQRGQCCFLEVRSSNAAARRLYEQVGFQRIGQRRAYYRDPPEDAEVYRLRLR